MPALHARYSKLFSRSLANVHHGGIRTIAQALRAGPLSRELTFGLKPIVEFKARLRPTLQINLVRAAPDFLLTG
jgi:hypothetical protein